MTNTAALEGNDFRVKDIGVNWVVTDLYGMLLEASREAAEMLNLSVTGLRSRQLLVFFDGEREHWRQALRAAAAGLMVDREGRGASQGQASAAGPGRDHQSAGLARRRRPALDVHRTGVALGAGIRSL